MAGKSKAKKVQGFCNALNIKFRLVLDRDAMITTEESDIKAIRRSLKGEEESISISISEFLEKEFYQFSSDLAKEDNLFIWKDGELEDFLLSKSEKSLKICEILSPGLKKKSENKKPKTKSGETNDKGNKNVDEKVNLDTDSDEEITYEKKKSIIKKALLNAISRDTLDELADEIIDFTETDRCLSFLKDK